MPGWDAFVGMCNTAYYKVNWNDGGNLTYTGSKPDEFVHTRLPPLQPPAAFVMSLLVPGSLFPPFSLSPSLAACPSARARFS